MVEQFVRFAFFAFVTTTSALAQFTTFVFTDPQNPQPNEAFLAKLFRPLGGCTDDSTIEISQVVATLTITQGIQSFRPV